MIQTPGRASARHVLLYDGDCGMCRRFARWLSARDMKALLEITAYQATPLPALMRRKAARSVQLLYSSGRREQRGKAVLSALTLSGTPLPHWLGWPPMIFLVDLGYMWISKHREWVNRRLLRGLFGRDSW